MLFLENCWESCWAPDGSCWHGMASCILCWGKQVFRAWWLEASSLCVYLLLLAPWVAFYPAGNTAWLLALGSCFLFPCLSCWPACWRKERQIPIFTDFLEMFKDGFARDLCIFFLSKSWPGWMLSEVWFPFPLPELFFYACCVLVHIFFSLLQFTCAGSSNQLWRVWYVSQQVSCPQLRLCTVRPFFLWNEWWFPN